MPTMSDKQAALIVLFETTHGEEDTNLFMAAERKALAAMLALRINAVRAAEEETCMAQ
jgi:hypothetical protein